MSTWSLANGTTILESKILQQKKVFEIDIPNILKHEDKKI